MPWGSHRMWLAQHHSWSPWVLLLVGHWNTQNIKACYQENVNVAHLQCNMVFCCTLPFLTARDLYQWWVKRFTEWAGIGLRPGIHVSWSDWGDMTATSALTAKQMNDQLRAAACATSCVNYNALGLNSIRFETIEKQCKYYIISLVKCTCTKM